MGLKTLLLGTVVLTSINQQPAPPVGNAELITSLGESFGSRFLDYQPSSRFGFTWTAGSLSSNKEYLAAAKAIDQRINGSSASFTAMLTKLRNEALEDSSSDDPPTQWLRPLPVFKWAYAKFKEGSKAANQGGAYWTVSANRLDLDIIRWLLSAVTQPKSGEFMRLRFLIQNESYQPNLVSLGRRLLVAQPDDKPVKRALAYHLAKSSQPQDFVEADTLAKELLESDPKSLVFLKLRSTIAFNAYIGDSTLANINKVITSLKDYIKVAPPLSFEGIETQKQLVRMEQLKKRKWGTASTA